MHPARSLILFTTLSGLGLGLLAFLGLGMPAVTGGTAFVFFALAYGLTLAGLAASTFHLGHPERALKAFREWRSSWLSREAWAAAITLTVMVPYGAALVFFDNRIGWLGTLGTLLCLITVFATSMIYAQLKTVPRWNTWSTPVIFLAYSIAGGALLSGEIGLASILLVLVGAAQIAAWATGDTRLSQSGSDTGTATALGDRGTVRAFEPPHTGSNYLTHEMINVVGRKHSKTLRIIAIGLFAVLPSVLLAFPFSHWLAAIAVLAHVAGVMVSRWLFFAEAEHVVGLYYGKR